MLRGSFFTLLLVKKYEFDFKYFFSDNYVLSGNTTGRYFLFSAMQQEFDPRLYDPFFGFAYMGQNAIIYVSIYQGSTFKYLISPSNGIQVSGMKWNYFARNLSSFPDSITTWPRFTSWRVKTFYQMDYIQRII